jgi:hypothetical protein
MVRKQAKNRLYVLSAAFLSALCGQKLSGASANRARNLSMIFISFRADALMVARLASLFRNRALLS